MKRAGILRGYIPFGQSTLLRGCMNSCQLTIPPFQLWKWRTKRTYRYCFLICRSLPWTKKRFSAMRSRVYGMKKTFQTILLQYRGFFQGVWCSISFLTGLRLTMQMPTAVFFFYRPKCAPLLYSRISVCRWIRWTKCGKHFRIIRI